MTIPTDKYRMDNIIPFPKRQLTFNDLPFDFSEEVSAEQAVNELTCELLCEIIPLYVENHWSMAELDPIVSQFTELMLANAPDLITRDTFNAMKDRLRPIWKDILLSARKPS